MVKKSKVGIAKKYSARYGVSLRRRLAEIESETAKKHQCPRCLQQKIRRISTSIWKCAHCNLLFAGGAYTPVVTGVIKREEVVEEEKEAVEVEKAEKKVQSSSTV